MASQWIELPAYGNLHWKAPVANQAALPATGNSTGDARVTNDNQHIFVWSGSAWVDVAGGGGTGTVTSVGLAAPAIFTVSGSPVTTSGTLTLTASGTSGGVPYFNASNTLASSGALTQFQVVLGGGAGGAPNVVSGTGTATQILTSNGAGVNPTWQAAPASTPTVFTGETAAGTTQGTALVYSGNGVHEITTAAANTGVKLITASAGAYNLIVNRGANAVKVYPNTSGTINGQAANAAFTINAKGAMEFYGKDTTGWYTNNSYQGNTQINTTDASAALVLGAATVPLTALASQVQTTLVGRASGAGSGSPTALTSAQSALVVGNFGGSVGAAAGTQGTVPQPPASSGGTVQGTIQRLLGAGGTWQKGLTTSSGYDFGYSPGYQNFNSTQFLPTFSGSIVPGYATTNGNYLYVADPGLNNVGIWNPDPMNGFNVGQGDVNDSANSVKGVAVSGNYAYVVGQNGSNQGFLRVYDNSRAGSCISVGVTTSAATTFGAVAIDGNYCYVSDITNNLMRVFDVSNKSAPTQVASIAVAQCVGPLAFAGKYVYLCSGSGVSNLYVVDVSTPTSPVAGLGGLTNGTGTTPTGIAVSGNGNYVFLINAQVLQVFVLNGNSLNSLSTYNLSTGATVISVLNHNVIINDGLDLLFLDFFAPGSMFLDATASGVFSTTPRGMTVLGRFAYVTGGTSGGGNNYVKGVPLPAIWVPQLETGDVTTTKLTVFDEANFEKMRITGSASVGRNLDVIGRTTLAGSLKAQAISATTVDASSGVSASAFTSNTNALSVNGVSYTYATLPGVIPSGQGANAFTQTTDATVLTVVAAPAGRYIVGGMINITTYTAGTQSLQVTYVDSGNVSQVLVLPLIALAGTISASIGSAADASSVNATIYTNGGSDIVIATVGTVFIGTYDVSAFVQAV